MDKTIRRVTDFFRALAEFGAPVAGMSPADFNDTPTSVFQMSVPPSRIDILQSIEGVEFEEAWPAHVDEMLAGDVISRDDLTKNKLAVGRLQDRADVEKIREVKQARESTDTMTIPAQTDDAR